MAQSEKELEKQLMDAGNAILSPPSSASELIPLLDRVEAFLTRVEQSPSESMRKALSSSIKALIATDLLRHSDIDVKVSVASCISEITRITAPDAPYDDDQMKEVFQLIVSSFEKLDDMNSPSYSKRTSILETVAKVRSCVVMLDLECDALILEMFQHFLRSIREYHPENVFSSMETIMTLVLEESEDISVDLLSSILDYLKIQDKEVLPVAHQLAEKVIEKCADKLKPYLLPAIKSKGASVNDYSKVVANVCQMESEAVEPSDGDAASKNLAEESADAPAEKPVEVATEALDDAPPSEEVGPATVGSPKSVVSNGNLQKERDIEETSVTNNDFKEENHDANNESKEENRDANNESKEENHDANNDSKEESHDANNDSKEENHDANDGVETAIEPQKASAESVKADELTKSESKPEKSNKRKGRKASSSKSISEHSEPPLTDDKETVKSPEHEERDCKDVDSARSKDTVADAVEPTAIEPTEQEKEPAAGVSSPRTAENEPADVTSPSPSGNPEEKHSKKDEQIEEKGDAAQETGPVSDVDPEKESDVKKTTESTNVSETKSQKRTGKKAASAAAKDDGAPDADDTSKKEGEDVPKVDTKSVKQSGKKVEAGSSQRDDRKKKGQAKGTLAKDLAKTPSKDDGKKPVPKSTAKSSKEESDADKTPKAGSKRKQNPGGEKASETKAYGAELVGSKIKVWWPADKMYYEGVVESFDPVKMKHKVVYVDGDVEILKLAKEKWQLLDDEVLPDQADASDAESPDESADMPKGKKAKIGADQGSKRGKTETTPKKGGASSSKTKSAPKSGRSKTETKAKSSEDNKSGKSKDLKAGNKSSEDAPKSAAKSKDDDALPKGSNKSKQETPKGGSKSKGKSPKAGTKSNSNVTGKGKAVSSPKEEEPEDAEESPEPTKAPEPPKGKSPSGAKSQKGSKKRKRGGKG